MFTVLNLVRGGAGVSLVPRSANLMHVPNVRLLDTRLNEAKWKIGLAWRKSEPLDPLIHNFIRLVREPSRAVPAVSNHPVEVMGGEYQLMAVQRIQRFLS